MFKNKALWITIAIIVVLLFAGYSWVKGTYNTMVTQDEGVKTAWSQVENQYQRRMDLIPNLVNTVKGYATHEKETLEGVVSARAEATKTTIDPERRVDEEIPGCARGTEQCPLPPDARYRTLSGPESQSELLRIAGTAGRHRKPYLGRTQAFQRNGAVL